MSSLRTQLTRFIGVGVVSAGVDFALLALLMRLGLGYMPAKALSFVAGTTTAYLLNRRWTFTAAGSRKKFASVLLLYGLTFVLQVGLFSLLYPRLVEAGLGAPLASFVNGAQIVGFGIAQGTATAVNFVVQRRWIFADAA